MSYRRFFLLSMIAFHISTFFLLSSDTLLHFVTRSVREMFNILRQHHVSEAFTFLPSAFINVHDSVPFDAATLRTSVLINIFLKFVFIARL